MLDISKAKTIVLNSVSPLKAEQVRLSEIFNRVLASDILALLNYPEFDRSVMDGFALRSVDSGCGITDFKCVGNIYAGKTFKKKISRGECAGISTGAMLPEGADSVAMKENVEFLAFDRVRILKKVGRGENVASCGRDFKKGTVLLKKGSLINMATVALLASQGINSVPVFRLPSVALVCTGDEIAENLKEKKGPVIWNASGPMLLYALKRLGILPKYLGKAGDDKNAIVKKISQGLKEDILLITGAVSVGEKDFVPDILKRCGVKIKFHKVAIKPGKPLLFGTKGRCRVFGIPGNPVSSLTSYLFFVLPMIKKMAGYKFTDAFEGGKLVRSVHNTDDRRPAFFPAKLNKKNDGFLVEPLRYSGSADLWAVAKADAFFMVEKNTRMPKGSSVSFTRIEL